MTRFSRARHVLFLAWLATTCLALAPAWPIARQIGSVDEASPAAIERWLDAANHLGPSILTLAVTIGIAALLSPFFSMTWLSALARPSTLSSAIGRGAALYPRSLVVALVLAPAFAVGIALAVGGPALGEAVLRGRASDPVCDLGSLACCLPGLAVLAVTAALHDLARARIAASDASALRAVRRALAAFSIPTLGSWLTFFAAGSALAALGHVLGLSVLGSGLVAIPVLELVVLGRLAVRGLWLSYTLDVAAARP